jgi:adenylate kinase family enzyme
MTKVAVIGNAGGGKSTLCRTLARARGLPHFAVDKIQWRPGWQLVSAEEFAPAHAALLDRDAWIIDGFGPWDEVEKRFDQADTIIFVDHPLWRHFWWAAKRQIASIFRERTDGPAGCPMLPVTLRLFTMMWRLHRDLRPKLLAAIAARRASKTEFHLRSPRELAQFRRQYCWVDEAHGAG